MKEEKQKEYYVYLHRRKDNGEVFYVGMGTKRDIKDFKQQHHRAYYSQDRNTKWKDISSNYGYDVEIVFTTFDKNEALAKESELIHKYKSTSCNVATYNTGIEINAYDRLGYYLETFESLLDAERKLNIANQNIFECTEKKRYFAGNYMFRKLSNEYPKGERLPSKELHNIIYCFDETLTYGNQYTSYSEACKKENLTYNQLNHLIRSKNPRYFISKAS